MIAIAVLLMVSVFIYYDNKVVNCEHLDVEDVAVIMLSVVAAFLLTIINICVLK
jgi:hypothetical protein